MKEKIKRGNQNKGEKEGRTETYPFFSGPKVREKMASHFCSLKRSMNSFSSPPNIDKKTMSNFQLRKKKCHGILCIIIFLGKFSIFQKKKKFDHHFNYREKKRRREERDKKVREKKIEKGRCVCVLKPFIGLPFLLSVGMCISAVLRDSVEGENVLQVR